MTPTVTLHTNLPPAIAQAVAVGRAELVSGAAAVEAEVGRRLAAFALDQADRIAAEFVRGQPGPVAPRGVMGCADAGRRRDR